MIKKSFKILILLFLLSSSISYSQNRIVKGAVYDEDTKEWLAFVNILSNDGDYGTSTDIDGKFQINLPQQIDSLILSYVGYERKTVAIRDKNKKNAFALKRKSYLLDEFEVSPKDNPAHRIIRNVIQYRDTNDPKKLKSYAYTSYDKMVITLDLDNKIETDSVIEVPDSIGSLRKIISDKDIMLMENVVEKKFLAPDRVHEKIVASRVSGLQDPLMTFVVSQVQSTSFYDEIIQMVNKNYINPISKGSFNKYYFQLQDTTYSPEGDSIFTISYVPYSNKNFDGLKGVLNISSKKWAIVNVKAEPLNSDEQGFNISIQQLYDFIEGHWFPIQLNTNIIFNNLITNSGGEEAHFIGVGKSYHKDIVLNPDLVKRQFSFVEVELAPNAGYQSEDFWEQHRVDSLTQRNQRTYDFMDSLGKAMDFDKTVKQFETVLTGKIPWGKLDIPLNKFVGYNNYEGFWAGAGIRTNKRISTKWDLGIYGGYAFRAQKAKYGIDGNLMLFKPYDLKIHAAYSKDYEEAAGMEFYDNQITAFNPETFRNFFVSRSNYTDRKDFDVRFRTLRYVYASVGLRVDRKEAAYDYFYQATPSSPFENIFDFTEFRVGIRFAYKERYFDNSRMLMSMGTNYPIVWLNYSKGLKGVLGGDYNYHRIDLRVKKSFYTKYLGESTFDVMGGVVIGDVPYSNLYRGLGTRGLVTVFAPSSFGSMGSAEFLSDRYVSLFFTHDFGNLLYEGKKFKPEIMLVTNVGFGWLDKPDVHKNVGFKTMKHGYFESGIMINRLVNLFLYNIGVGATYRYGAYSNPDWQDNISFKITLTLPIEPAFGVVE